MICGGPWLAWQQGFINLGRDLPILMNDSPSWTMAQTTNVCVLSRVSTLDARTDPTKKSPSIPLRVASRFSLAKNYPKIEASCSVDICFIIYKIILEDKALCHVHAVRPSRRVSTISLVAFILQQLLCLLAKTRDFAE